MKWPHFLPVDTNSHKFKVNFLGVGMVCLAGLVTAFQIDNVLRMN